MVHAEIVPAAHDRTSWDWQVGTRELGKLAELADGFVNILELRPSPDGEQLAMILERQPDQLRVRAGSELYETELEKAMHLGFFPDGRPWLLARVDDEWTVMVAGQLWDERWEFVWNPKLSADGRALAVQIKRDMEYSIAVNGVPWENSFASIREYALNADGSRVAVGAQLEELPEADIFKFLEGTWSVVVDGVPWEKRYLNVYAPTIAPDDGCVVAEVRTDLCEYTVARDDTPWGESFSCVWEPRFRGTRVVIPARRGGSWTLVEDGQPLWTGSYVQLWKQVFNPDESRVAAAVAPSYGQWTIAVDDRPWGVTFNDLIGTPHWSPAGDRIAAVAKSANRWRIVVDGVAWAGDWDMVWEPVFSPDGSKVVAKVEQGKSFTYVVDGRPWRQSFSHLWEPVISPDSKDLLVRGVREHQYVRQVIPLSSLG